MHNKHAKLQSTFIKHLLIHMYMLHPAIFGTFFFHISLYFQIKIWVRLHHKTEINISHKKLLNSARKSQTSMAGSNIFFNNKHSLGDPINSAAILGITGAVTAGTGTAGCPTTGKLMAC